MRLKHNLVLLLLVILMGIPPGAGTRAGHGGPIGICVTPDGRNVPCSHPKRRDPEPPEDPQRRRPNYAWTGCWGQSDRSKQAKIAKEKAEAEERAKAQAQARTKALVGKSVGITRFLGELADHWRVRGDLRYGFADAHQCMSRQITAAAKAGKFRDPDWVLKLNYQFGILFDRALNGWDERKSLRRKDVPKAWKIAFTTAENIQKDRSWPGGQKPWIAPDRVTLTMAGAHIFNDLTVTLRKEGCRSKSDFRYIMDLVDRCELKVLGLARKTIKDVGARIGVPGADSIRQWRISVWNYVCERGPHPSQVFR